MNRDLADRTQMLFNWETTNLCIVFRSWHIRGPTSFLLSMLAISLLVAGFEALRAYTSAYSAKAARDLESLPSMLSPRPQALRVSAFEALQFVSLIGSHGKRKWLVNKVAQKITESFDEDVVNESIAEMRPLLGIGQKRAEVGGVEHVVKAFLYAAQTFYAFMIM